MGPHADLHGRGWDRALAGDRAIRCLPMMARRCPVRPARSRTALRILSGRPLERSLLRRKVSTVA